MTTELRRPIEELHAAYGEALTSREIELEESMVALGRNQIRKQIESAKKRGNESGTEYGKNLVAMSVEKIGGAILDFIAKAEAGGSGRRHIAVKYLKQINPEIAAYIAMRCVVDSLTGKRQLLQRTAIIIGGRIEDEVRFDAFAKEQARLYKLAVEKAKKSTSYHRKKATMTGYERRFSDHAWDAWPEAERLHLGMCLLEMIVCTGLIEVGEEIVSRTKTNKLIVPTAKLVEWIERESRRSELLTPTFMPMIVRPLDWTTPYDGGYLTQETMGRHTMVKVRSANYLTELADHAETMPMVYDSLNALQSTRWQINSRVHATLSTLWELGHETSGLPSREDIGAVSCPCCGVSLPLATLNTRKSTPHECFEAPEILREWKKEAYKSHERNVSLRSKRLSLAKSLRIADQFVKEDAIHFPYQLDFRGRIYCMPSFNPQGNDIDKGLLHFADAKPIEDGVAAGWLAIQGANVWGFDKETLEDRVQWVEDHQELITSVAADPIGDTRWADADKPFQFLAFCFEWSGFLEQGFGFMSRLPVALDGSCSGIQHFSAMLRDTIGGNAVNLIPADKPQDIYQQVCDRVVLKLEQDVKSLSASIAPETQAIGASEGASEGDETHTPKQKEETQARAVAIGEIAQGWLDLGLSRKTTKRQVMTLPYGSTRYSCREYTEQWLKDQLVTKQEPWPQDQRFKATQYLSDLIWVSIGEVVVAARQAMGWLQKCAKVVASEDLPVYWTTPTGFLVMQEYKNTSSRRIKTKMGDTIVKLSLQQEEVTLDKRRMQNAISPNVVHSLDATHLMMAVCYGVDNGITSFSLIHDSFGTHATDTNVWAACIRKAFVDLYADCDVLGELREQFIRQVAEENVKDIPPVPPKGDLDIQVVMHSDFAFA